MTTRPRGLRSTSMSTCAHHACLRPGRAFGVCRVHLNETLAAGRRAAEWTPARGRLAVLLRARYGAAS